MSRELKATLPFLLRSQKRLEPAKVFLSQYLGKDSGLPQRRRASSPGLGPPAEMTRLWEMVQGCWWFQPRGKQSTPGTLG